MKKNHETIYPYAEKAAVRFIERLREDSDITPYNREKLIQYLDYIAGRGSQLKRQGKIAHILNVHFKGLDDIYKLSLLDIQSIIAKVARSYRSDKLRSNLPRKERSEATKADYRKSLKSFFKWYEDYDPRLQDDNFKVRTQTLAIYKYLQSIPSAFRKTKIDPTEVINEADLDLILEKGTSIPKEKAIISLLHETGARAGEILSMKVKHFQVFKSGLGKIFLPVSKTEERNVDILTSVPYLVRYIDLHPGKNNPDSPLWYKDNLRLSKKDIAKGMSYDTIYPLGYTGFVKILSRSFKRAGLKKKCNIHWFRHSRASIDATKLSPEVRCRRLGWSSDTKQLANYTHLADEDITQAYLKSKGISLDDKPDQIEKKCGCGTYNRFNARYCLTCGKPVSLEIFEEDQQKIKEETESRIKLMMEYMADPEFRVAFSKFKEEMKNK